jgi:DNA modification methylase
MAKKSAKAQKEKLFEETFVPAAAGSGKLFDVAYQDKNSQPIECLGIKFPNDQARREYFTQILRDKLNDPEFRKIDGFPIGVNEDILAMSDPPWFTACPNPFLTDLIHASDYCNTDPSATTAIREPFSADVTEGKGDPIYNAHSYHTKVPHKAIMRYILHYTSPGDIVLDGFCGTGMTGVAAQLCGDPAEVRSLGYRLEDDGRIFKKDFDASGTEVWKEFSRLGARRAILNDLSPAATFISYNYNSPEGIFQSIESLKTTLKEIESNFKWVYETFHKDGRKGTINYTVLSDVFCCNECSKEFVFWNAAISKDRTQVRDEFECPHCKSKLNKRSIDHAWTSSHDVILQKTIRQTKRVPVLINYTISGKRFEKAPDSQDLEVIKRIQRMSLDYFIPTQAVPEGDKTGEPIRIGLTHAHHFYTKRNLLVLSALWNGFKDSARGKLAITSVLIKTASLLHNIGLKGGKINLAGALPNAMYVPSTIAERNLFTLIDGKLDDFRNAGLRRLQNRNTISTGSLGADFFGKALESKVDYIFIDPPFGSNLHYSELSFLWDAWLGVVTNNTEEAIESRSQGKRLDDYRQLMTKCFRQAFIALKPGRWMTVEFSNTSSAVWNNIQTALSEAGFVVGNVSALNKGQGTFNSQTNPTSVKQDLVISAYKPESEFESVFRKNATQEESVWDFIRNHLRHLPVVKRDYSTMQVVSERDPRILFDQMVAYYVRNGFSVPISSQNFRAGLLQRFPERDGMIFLADQLSEYEAFRMANEMEEQQDLFVNDERSAIQWVRRQLHASPRKYQDLSPEFMKEAQRIWEKHELPLELREILEQNFVQDVNENWHLPDLKKESDLEQLRNRALLKEFAAYRDSKGKLKVVRSEALRAGFKECWQKKDFITIVQVAKRVPDTVIQEDPALLMYFDNASLLLGE